MHALIMPYNPLGRYYHKMNCNFKKVPLLYQLDLSFFNDINPNEQKI